MPNSKNNEPALAKPVNKSSVQQRFSFDETKADKVMIFSSGKLAKTLTGKEAIKFLNKMDLCREEPEKQLLMAKITGQFKFGNERQGKNSLV
jgi:hypothetical protein